jgi:hypothetical protein
MLKCTDEVTGYREVRYPKMEKARVHVEKELAETPKLELDIKREVLERVQQTSANV